MAWAAVVALQVELIIEIHVTPRGSWLFETNEAAYWIDFAEWMIEFHVKIFEIVRGCCRNNRSTDVKVHSLITFGVILQQLRVDLEIFNG